MEVSGSVRDADARDNASVDVAEPSAKRQKLSTRRISGEELCHLDSEPFDNLAGLEIENLYRDDNVDISDDCDDDVQYDASMMPPSLNSPSVWQPYTGAEPEISHDVLALIDQGADKIEIRRHPEMGVITTVDKYDGQLDLALSAKMVRTWKKKTIVEVGLFVEILSCLDEEIKACWKRFEFSVVQRRRFQSCKQFFSCEAFTELGTFRWFHQGCCFSHSGCFRCIFAGTTTFSSQGVPGWPGFHYPQVPSWAA